MWVLFEIFIERFVNISGRAPAVCKSVQVIVGTQPIAMVTVTVPSLISELLEEGQKVYLFGVFEDEIKSIGLDV